MWAGGTAPRLKGTRNRSGARGATGIQARARRVASRGGRGSRRRPKASAETLPQCAGARAPAGHRGFGAAGRPAGGKAQRRAPSRRVDHGATSGVTSVRGLVAAMAAIGGAGTAAARSIQNHGLAAGRPRPGVAAVLEKVRRRARRFGDGHDLLRAHEWRKALLALRDQISQVAAMRGLPEGNLPGRLHRITHRLGLAIDCRVLRRVVKNKRWPGSLDDPARQFAAVLRKKQRHLLKRAWRSWGKLKPALRRLRGTVAVH